MEYNIAISTIFLSALVILQCMVGKSEAFFIRSRNFFLLAITAVMLVIASEVIDLYTASIVDLRWLRIAANSIGFSAAPFIPLLIGGSIYDNSKISLLAWVPPIVNTIAAVFPTGLIFFVDLHSNYSRGSAFWIFIAAYGFGFIFLFYKTLHSIKLYQNTNKFILILLFLFLTFGTSVQVIRPNLYTTWPCITLSLGLYYSYFCEFSQQLDGLTGLLNRRSYEKYLCRLDGTQSVHIIFFDVDTFKEINDHLGHLEGDQCLTILASCIRAAFFNLGTCYRIGGDEFCVISKQLDPSAIQNAQNIFFKNIASCQKSKPWLPSVSIGCAFYNQHNGSIQQAIQEADRRMYTFKKNRKTPADQSKEESADAQNSAFSF